MREIKIKNRIIGENHPPFIVSEIGAMYEDIEGMKLLIKKSKEAGADGVKIQTYSADTISLKGAEFKFEDGSVMSQYDFFKKYEISKESHKILFDYADKLGIMIFSTPSHFEDADFLETLGVPAYKTGSDDLTNYPFLKYLAEKGKPVIMSTGMATLSEIEMAVDTVLKTGNKDLILLHCTVAYPPEPEFANLNIINSLKETFGIPVGYSDHIFGTFSGCLAASMGACMIEKHVTLDRTLKRADYQVSLEPSELREMVEQIRLIDVLKGSKVKKVFPPEEKWRRNARKSLVAAVSLNKGEVLKKEDIKIIRPGTGIHPKDMDFVAGRVLKRDIKENEILSMDCLY